MYLRFTPEITLRPVVELSGATRFRDDAFPRLPYTSRPRSLMLEA